MNRRIVTLCGSTRFSEAFSKANHDETMLGVIILTVGVSDKTEILSDIQKRELDALHRDKIAISDEILVLNVGGYIGDSTMSEIAFAMANGKAVRFIDEIAGEAYLSSKAHVLGSMIAAFVLEP